MDRTCRHSRNEKGADVDVSKLGQFILSFLSRQRAAPDPGILSFSCSWREGRRLLPLPQGGHSGMHQPGVPLPRLEGRLRRAGIRRLRARAFSVYLTMEQVN